MNKLKNGQTVCLSLVLILRPCSQLEPELFVGGQPYLLLSLSDIHALPCSREHRDGKNAGRMDPKPYAH